MRERKSSYHPSSYLSLYIERARDAARKRKKYITMENLASERAKDAAEREKRNQLSPGQLSQREQKLLMI